MRVPAVCMICGTLSLSAFPLSPNSSVSNSISTCPKCSGPAKVIDGYTTIINDLVVFIESPEIKTEEKRLLIDTANNVAKGTLEIASAVKALERSNSQSAMLLTAWISVGIAFVHMMAYVADIAMSHVEKRNNQPLPDVVNEAFQDEVGARKPKPNPTRKRPLMLVPNKRSEGAPSAKPPQENLKQKRARAAKAKKQSSKSRRK